MESDKKFARRLLVVAAVLPALMMVLCFGVVTAHAETASAATAAAGAAASAPVVRWDLALGMALAIGLACVGAGFAVGKVGAAALGAATERPELLTRSLIFVGLAEGIGIYGLLIALLLFSKMPKV